MNWNYFSLTISKRQLKICLFERINISVLKYIPYLQLIVIFQRITPKCYPVLWLLCLTCIWPLCWHTLCQQTMAEDNAVTPDTQGHTRDTLGHTGTHKMLVTCKKWHFICRWQTTSKMSLTSNKWHRGCQWHITSDTQNVTDLKEVEHNTSVTRNKPCAIDQQ